MVVPYIPVEIEKVLELKGALRPDFNCPTSIYAHVSRPVKKEGRDVQYVLMAIFPQHGMMNLGTIKPNTQMFEKYSLEMGDFAFYERANNHVVKRVLVPTEQLNRLPILEDILRIPGISIKRELIPKD